MGAYKTKKQKTKKSKNNLYHPAKKYNWNIIRWKSGETVHTGKAFIYSKMSLKLLGSWVIPVGPSGGLYREKNTINQEKTKASADYYRTRENSETMKISSNNLDQPVFLVQIESLKCALEKDQVEDHLV